MLIQVIIRGNGQKSSSLSSKCNQKLILLSTENQTIHLGMPAII
ncbi:hypothetical protein MuYL_1350 [Mucilaginibacter xinganensis]|uniref:Uncharacterized protein n=1 Tax=Mucilaginibacter xinganensis TaxID=1234841 RepID=A0A223NUD9_9SPHI|nr:hypothetical protein MuYL_1350 [Mucilaginibacter xinganensis]